MKKMRIKIECTNNKQQPKQNKLTNDAGQTKKKTHEEKNNEISSRFRCGGRNILIYTYVIEIVLKVT